MAQKQIPNRYLQAEGRQPGTKRYRVNAYTVRAHSRRYPWRAWHRTDMTAPDATLLDTALCMLWVVQARRLARGRKGYQPDMIALDYAARKVEEQMGAAR